MCGFGKELKVSVRTADRGIVGSMDSDNIVCRQRYRARSLSAAVLLVVLAFCWPAATALADTATAPPTDSGTSTQPADPGATSPSGSTTDPATDPNASSPSPDPGATTPPADTPPATDPGTTTPPADPGAGAPPTDPGATTPPADPGTTDPVATDPATTGPAVTDPAVTAPVDPSSQLALSDPAAGDQWQLPSHSDATTHPADATPGTVTPPDTAAPAPTATTPVLGTDSMSFTGAGDGASTRGPPLAIVLSHKDGPLLPSAIDQGLVPPSAPPVSTDALPSVAAMVAPPTTRSHHPDSAASKRAHPPLRPIVRTPPPGPTTPPTTPVGASGVASAGGSAAGPNLALLLSLFALASLLGASTVRRSQVLPVRGLRLGGALSRAPPAV